MKKGSKVRIVKEQEDRAPWMTSNNFYWGFGVRDNDFYQTTVKVGKVYEVLKVRGVKGPTSGFIEIKNENNESVLVLKNDVIEVKNE